MDSVAWSLHWGKIKARPLLQGTSTPLLSAGRETSTAGTQCPAMGDMEPPPHFSDSSNFDNDPLASLRQCYSVTKLASATRQLSPYCKYVPVCLSGICLSGLVDSGNTARTASSHDLYRCLGFRYEDLRPVPGLRISTAKESDELSVLGETPRRLRLVFASLSANPDSPSAPL